MKCRILPSCLWLRQRSSSQGLSLLEVIVVVVIVGILAAIAAPSWLKYVANQRVTAARDEVRQGILLAQSSAIAHRSSWRFSIREIDDHLAWAIHPDSVDWSDVTVWNTLHSTVIFYDKDTTMVSKDGTYYVRFNYRGDVAYRLSTVTFDSVDGSATNKCVVISTLIGATRKGQEQLYPNGERYCY